jgi:hypothetical protein
MSKKKICDVCYEEADQRLTDEMKPICDLCYEDARRFQDTKYACTAQESEEPGDLSRCREYDRALNNLLNKVSDNRRKITTFQENLEIHYLLYPELEENKAIDKEIEIIRENLNSEEDTILRTQEIQKVACSTKSASRLRRVEQFLGCYTVSPPIGLKLPLPKGEQQSEVNTYTLRNRIIYGTTFNGKVIFSDFYRLHQIVKREGQISEEFIFQIPQRHMIMSVSEDNIITRDYRQRIYYVYNRRFELVTEFSLGTKEVSGIEYVPPTRKKPALLISHDLEIIRGSIIENGLLKEIWSHHLSIMKVKVFSSSILVLTSTKILIIHVDTGEILWEEKFRIQDKKIYHGDVNLGDGRIHTARLNDDGDVIYTVYSILGEKRDEIIPKERFTEIIPLNLPILTVPFPRFVVNPDTEKTYLFLV